MHSNAAMNWFEVKWDFYYKFLIFLDNNKMKKKKNKTTTEAYNCLREIRKISVSKHRQSK